jgi:hypothetical protein
MKLQTKKFDRKIRVASAIICIVGVALFWIILLITQSLTPGYNPIRQSLSDLTLGPYYWLETIDYVILALVAMAMGFGLYLNMPKKSALRIAVILFGIMALGEIISAVFKVDLVKSPLSIHALIHQIGASAVAIGFPLAGLFLLPSLKAEQRWKGLTNYTFAVAVSMLILEIIREALLPTTWLNPWFGLYEKVLLANSSVWIEVMAIRLLRVHD